MYIKYIKCNVFTFVTNYTLIKYFSIFDLNTHCGTRCMQRISIENYEKERTY